MFSQGEDEECVFNLLQDLSEIKTPCPWTMIVLAHQEVKAKKGAKKGLCWSLTAGFVPFWTHLIRLLYWFVGTLNLTGKD